MDPRAREGIGTVRPMSDATKSRTQEERPGFSSRWILDGARGDAAAKPGVERAAALPAGAAPIDTDGDGIADTLAVRVDQAHPSLVQRFGRWLGRSIALVVFVAALVAAAVAATSYVQANAERDDARSELLQVRNELTRMTAERDAATAKVTKLTGDAATAKSELEAAQREQAELELQSRVLRGMLLDAEAPAAVAPAAAAPAAAKE